MPHSDLPVVIVTGAGRGLGRDHALALARAGYAVVVNDLGGAGDGSGADAGPAAEVVAEIEALGGKAIADNTDVTNWDAAGGLIQRAVDAFGRLDALVNNAGCLRDRTIANLTEADWDVVVNVNLKGAAAPLHHAARYWRDLSKSRGAPVNAAVVNTTSGSGLFANPGQGNYAAAKAGVAALTIVAARELARYGVRVNTVAPIAATRLTATVGGGGAMMERLNPALVSPLIVYLLSARAEAITGRIFEMGGGAISSVDPYRPVAALRADDEGWTEANLAEVVPDLVAQLPAEITSLSAADALFSAPVRTKTSA
jgi:NAD(P)-dependent dehydrogenase (short-subunit alcohol dehydrogenase family)